ncbi:MAG: cadmium-translocating P-type ATPase [Clostridia bacterium]|nr:cadmium-translocating P-type ATPase [Clostridia bacterium]
MKTKFSVGGMTCSACSAGIEKHVSRLDGVISARVSLLDKTMLVEYDEQILGAEKIIAVVEKIGYTAEIYGQKNHDKLSDAKKLKRRFLISLILLLPLMYFSMGVMLGAPAFSKKINFAIQWAFATAIIIINGKFFINGVKAVLRLSPNMDTLVSLGSASAYLFSVTVTILLYLGTSDPSHTFFEGSAMVLTLVTLGKWLEELSKVKTGDAIEKLNKLIPKTATVLIEGKEKTVLTGELKVGDVLVLKAGDYIAVDGKIIEGSAGVDKSAITGESIPVELTVGDSVTSGSILKSGYLLVQATSVGQDTLFSKIVEIVKYAGASKAPIQKIADKVSGVFVPIVSIIALMTFTVWMIITRDVYSALNFGISVLVISCPCALGLATPVAVMAGAGKAASYGVLFKNAEAMQNACKVNCVLLDKTATITVGKPKVTDYINLDGSPDSKIKSMVSSLESKSSHPIAKCVMEFCGENYHTVDNFEYIVGKGIVGEIGGVKYYLGNLELLPKTVKIKFDKDKYFGKTLVYFADDFAVIAVFAVSDYVKEDSALAIKELNNSGVKTVMITGDNESTAKRIADEVGIEEYYANVLPQDKYSIVEKYKANGYFVAMVGDGINDSPALKSAHLGVAMGTGTDIAIDSADVVIASGSLKGVTDTVKISKKTIKIIKQNLFWAFFYNVIAIPVSAGAFAFLGVALTPAIASACMSCSSLFVVTNALRIARKKKAKKNKDQSTQTITVLVEGMMCKHCQTKVQTALEGIDGVSRVEVDLQNKKATLELTESVADDTIITAVENAGFKVNGIIR